jgi:hypothetical protein
MNNLTARAYLRSLLIDSMFLIILLMIFVICYGYKGDHSFIFQTTDIATMILVPIVLLQHCRGLFMFEKSELSFPVSVLAGFASGFVLTFAIRTAQALNYLFWSSDRKTGTLISIFGDSWYMYLCMGLLGIVFMLVRPFFKKYFA